MVSVGVLYLLATVLAVHAQDCPRPQNGPAKTVLVSADIVKDTFLNGATATWECELGYSIVGGNRRQKCTAGTWDPAIVTVECDRKTCGSIPEPDNGRIDFPDGSQFGDTAVIICNPGHKLVGGTKERRCGVDGNWDGRFGRCDVVKCGRPDDILNGKYSPVREDYDYGFVVTYTCDKTFTLDGQKSLDCRDDGQFHPAPPTCKVVVCPTPDVEHLSRVQGGPPPYGYKSHLTYKCDAGFEMEGTPSVTCEISGSWSPPIPTCKALPTTTATTTTTKKEDDGAGPSPTKTSNGVDPPQGSTSKTVIIVVALSVVSLLTTDHYNVI